MAENATPMALLKANLGFYGSDIDPAVETYLRNLLEYAAQALSQDCGLVLFPGSIEDDHLQAMYAAWIYRKGGEGTGKPPMLQMAIRNAQLRARRGCGS